MKKNSNLLDKRYFKFRLRPKKIFEIFSITDLYVLERLVLKKKPLYIP